ncbi:hypothetical protein BRADI_3g21603v3 [Brachypodium distachyon]|uniref:Uncharacterized protein n=1 Tax=Brachypodium distachyon TaxID=15368 RepID=A0A2K2CYQ2_BRADI|nr:hypothetical protein BRADI_3g21603v3 [Brachypodium distachyon]
MAKVAIQVDVHGLRVNRSEDCRSHGKTSGNWIMLSCSRGGVLASGCLLQRRQEKTCRPDD